MTESLEAGGIASLIGNACATLPDQNMSCFCICLDTPGEHAAARVPEASLLVLGLGRQSFTRRSLLLARALRQLRVDILHTHGRVLAEGLAAAVLARVPLLMHGELGGSGGASDQLLRRAAPLVSRFVVGSRQALAGLSRVARVSGDRVRLLTPTVDLDHFRAGKSRDPARERLGVGSSQILVGSLGQLQPSRNYAVLLEAIALMRGEGADVRCLLVGDGYQADTLSQQARQLGIAERLQITGFTHDVPPLLAAMDIFVLPSGSDHLPQSLLEAMAAGLPLVVGSGGPVAEVVRDGENGLLVPPDRPRILARILKQLADSPSRRAALGAQARRTVEQHHPRQRAADELARLYRELV